MARIVLLSDTHLQHEQYKIDVPDGDMLIHAGDFTIRGRLREFQLFADWFRKQPHALKIVIAGNHEISLEQGDVGTRVYAREILESTGAKYLQDEGYQTPYGLVYGSPWQPEFNDWAFNLPRNGPELEAKWRMIPEDTEILVTHCPPYGLQDWNDRARHLGCEKLRTRVQQLEKLRLHVYGHIHEAYGSTTLRGVQFVNAAICNLSYDPVNKPVVVEL